MPVLEFECQLARSQISRYMGGEVLSEDLLRHLGGHVADCPGCRDFLEQRRAALKVMLGADAALASAETAGKKHPSHEPRLTHAVVQVEEEAPLSAREVLMNRLRGQASALGLGASAAETPSEAVPAPKKVNARQLGKPALYSVGLAAVLVAMSWMVKSPNGFLGPKALGSSISASNNPSPEASKPAASQPAASQGGAKTAPAAAAKLTPPKNQAQADAILQAEATNKPVSTAAKSTALEPKKDLQSAVAAPTAATAVKTPIKPIAKIKKKATAHKTTVRHTASHRITRRPRRAVKHTAKRASGQVSIKVYNP